MMLQQGWPLVRWRHPTNNRAHDTKKSRGYLTTLELTSSVIRVVVSSTELILLLLSKLDAKVSEMTAYIHHHGMPT
jgi:hypothetical protein